MSCYGSLANSASNLASYSDGNKDGFKNKNTDFHRVQHILSQNKSTGILHLRNKFCSMENREYWNFWIHFENKSILAVLVRPKVSTSSGLNAGVKLSKPQPQLNSTII